MERHGEISELMTAGKRHCIAWDSMAQLIGHWNCDWRSSELLIVFAILKQLTYAFLNPPVSKMGTRQ